MKKLFLIVLTLCTVTAFADSTADAMVSARLHASQDVKNHNTAGWGWGSFGLSLLLSPLLGGGIMIISAYDSGDEPVPAPRFAWASREFDDDSTALLIYESEYTEMANEARKKKNVSAAWTGTLSAFAVNMIIILAITAQ